MRAIQIDEFGGPDKLIEKNIYKIAIDWCNEKYLFKCTQSNLYLSNIIRSNPNAKIGTIAYV